MEYNWYMLKCRCEKYAPNREYLIVGTWEDFEASLIRGFGGKLWFEGIQSCESAIAEDDGVTILPVAYDGEQVFILQQEAMCWCFFNVC